MPTVPVPAHGHEPAGSLRDCPCPSRHIPGAGWRRREESIPPPGRAALPYTPPEPSLCAAFEICPSVFNIGVPDPPPPPRGGFEGPCLYAAHADRQQPGSARQSQPLSACHLKIKGEGGDGSSDGKPGLPVPLPLHQCPRDRTCHPSGGFGHVSKFLGFSNAGRMGNPKAEVWDGFLEEEDLHREVGLCPRGRGVSVMPASSLGGLPAEMLQFGK